MKIQVAIIGWAYTTLCLVSYADAFSHGASFVACVDMKPRHIKAQLQNPRNNYITIYTNMSSYSPGEKVPVTVRSRGDFMGFLLQARRISNDQIAGTFVFIPSGSKLMSCFEEANTVAHSDKSPKRNLSFVWKAPHQPIGDIKFFLSVVQSYFIYWERIESAIVSQQTQNRTLSDGNVEPAASLQKPNGLEVTTTDEETRTVSEICLKSQNWTQDGSDLGTAEPCLHCDEGEQESPEAYNLTLTRPPSSKGVPFTVHLPYFQLIMGTKAEAQNDGGFANSSMTSRASSALRLLALRLSGLPKSSASFLPQSEYMNPREESNGEDSTGPPPMTKSVLENVGSGLREDSSPPRPEIVRAQLGILLCLSATLGMALAAGLRYLHAQFCRQRTEVSFGEPDSDIIAVNDIGERMHFRKIQENSVMLVQAEYNWITPNGGAKRAAV